MDYTVSPNWLVRLRQRWHLRFTRLGRLLRRRGADLDDYVKAFPIVEVEYHFARCHLCQRQPLCDRVLQAKHVPGKSRYSFCPNTPLIDSYFLSRRRR